MALPFLPSDAAMLGLQAGVVAAPRAVARPRLLSRVTSRWWAVVPIGSIVAVIFAIRYASGTATGLTYLALVAVPPLAAVALAWAARGPRGWPVGRAVAAVAVTGILFALAALERNALVGEGAAALLSALSCVTLGVLLAAVTPPAWLKLGILAMAAADTWLVISDLLQAPNATLVAAAPAAGLPRLQSETFGSVSMGYGDMFVAGLLGALTAGSRATQRTAALLTLLFASAFDVLFLVLNELPATVPVALALIAIEAVSAVRRRSRRVGAIPRRAT
ncbi:MAG: hypothetical protein JO342_03325 [Solirubrobacterales bacterium]|nr:hypothetical protein [Solirubrobacterales bacterium]